MTADHELAVVKEKTTGLSGTCSNRVVTLPNLPLPEIPDLGVISPRRPETPKKP